LGCEVVIVNPGKAGKWLTNLWRISMATVCGLFERYEDASRALERLNEMGYGQDHVSVVAPENMVKDKLTGEFGTSEDTAKSGAVVGGLAGLLLGVGLIIVPGIGPILGAGALATAIGSTAVGAGLGAAAGGLRGALAEMGVPEAEATAYEEGVQKGGILVTVITESEGIQEVKDTLKAYNTVDLGVRRSIEDPE
jgi:uncharacterized membrane protein